MFILALVTYTSDVLRENLQNIIEVRSAKKRRAIDMFMRSGKAWESIVIEHPHGTNYMDMGTVDTDYDDNDTTIVIKKDPNTPMLVRPNQKFHNVATGETMYTSSTSADIDETDTTITCDNVTREIDDTTAAAGTAGQKIVIGLEVLPENSQHSGSDHFTSERQDYFTQIFKRNLEISGSTQAIEKMIANGDARFNELVQRALDHLENVKLYQAIFRGVHGASSTKKNAITGAADDRCMDGIINAIKRFNGITLDVNGSLDSIVLDAQLAKIIDLDGPVETDIAEGAPAFGPSSYVGFCNSTVKNKVNYLDSETGRLRREQKDVFSVNYIGTTVGPLAVDWVVVPPFVLFDDEAVVVRKDQYNLGPLNGRQFAAEPMGKTGDGGKWHVLGEMGGELDFPECGLYLYGIT